MYFGEDLLSVFGFVAVNREDVHAVSLRRCSYDRLNPMAVHPFCIGYRRYRLPDERLFDQLKIQFTANDIKIQRLGLPCCGHLMYTPIPPG